MDLPPKQKRRSNLFDRVTVGGIILAILVFLLYWGFQTPKAVIIADEGFKKVKASIDPEEWRAWALDILKNPKDESLYQKMPESIRTLYSEPPGIMVDADCVVLSWGGGFFHWQIDIGATNYSEKTGIDSMFTTAEWVPGIYYSREDTRHPIQ